MSSGSEKRSSNAYTAASIESSHGILFTHSCALSGSSTDRPLETPRLAISRRPTSPSDSVGVNLAVILVRSYGGSGNGNMNYFPAFGDDIVVAIDSDIMNEAGLLLRMRLVYCFRGKVNAFLKKAYLGGCCYQRRTGHQVCHPVHFRWAGPKYFMESEGWLGHDKITACPPWVWR